MPRNYKRKTNHGQRDIESITVAVKAIKVDGISIHAASKAHGIPYKTLQRYTKKIEVKCPDVSTATDIQLTDAVQTITEHPTVCCINSFYFE